MLLPLLLAARLEPADLEDLGLVVLARKEKAQRSALLKHLAALAPSDPSEREVLVRLLTTAAESHCAARPIPICKMPNSMVVPWLTARRCASLRLSTQAGM